MGSVLFPEQIQSDALIRNMSLTDVEVVVPVSFEVLQEAVKGYAGKELQARELLMEYHHRFRNWQFVIQETWRYALSNLRLYARHPLNGSIVYLLSHIFLEALKNSERPENRRMAADHLIAYWLKLADEMADGVAAPMPDGVRVEEMAEKVEGVTSCHQGILRFFLRELYALPRDPFEYLMRSFYQVKRLAPKLLDLWPDESSLQELRLLLQRLAEETYEFWLDKEDPCAWLAQQDSRPPASLSNPNPDPPWLGACEPLSHKRHRACLNTLRDEIKPEEEHRKAVAGLVRLPDYHDIVRHYSRLPEELKAFEGIGSSSHLSLLMRLKIMQLRGLEGIHEDTLREINFHITREIRQESPENLEGFLNRVFDVLVTCLGTYPEAAMQIVRSIGLEVIATNNWQLIDFFLKRTINLGFQGPKLGGVSQYWQVEMNPAHLPNIRIWLELIKSNPAKTRVLLSALIVNLALGGIYIKDTDLFQKDVSLLLHVPIRPIYNLVKQMAKLFPIYFNQIGAEGQLRTVSTDVDELTGRSDRLVHFLRKQSHVESNNVIVTFIEAIIDFWRVLDKSKLERLVPPEIYAEIATSGPLVDDMHRIFVSIFESKTIHHPKDLLDLSEEQARSIIEDVAGAPERERKRAFLIIQFYQLLHEKYALSFRDIHVQLKRAANLGLPDPTTLLEALDSTDSFVKLDAILDYLLELKEVILSPGELHIMENIYYKRHIAVDIPSMYGTYNERKFDALGLTFRLENLANVLFEETILSFDLSIITRATFFRISKFLPLFSKALALEGITSNRLELQAELFHKALEVRRFSHSQYMDIFRGFSEAIKQIIQTYYHAVHEETLDVVIKQLGRENLLPRHRREGKGETFAERAQRVSESFLRDLIARTFGLQYFDHFITSILTTLATQREVLSSNELDVLLSYDPGKTISLVYEPNRMADDLIHMGNKGYNLVKLHSIGIRVPPAFVITTEYFRCRSVVANFPQARDDLQERVLAHVGTLEEVTGRRFGSPSNPLLVSVRSGSAVSMPGMMNTFLNVGINEAIVQGLIDQMKQAWFGWDNYRRFIQSWGMSFGMQRDEFDSIMRRYKSKYGRKVKREFLPEEMRELALAYKGELKARKIELYDSPRDQLFTAVRQVMESWYYPKAKTYRQIMGLSENWGTAVTIQAMVYGNLDISSGAGVMFTHNPKTSEDIIEPVGDLTWGNQGEDVVGGLVQTLPLSEKQRLSEDERREHSLETLFPRVYRKLVQIAHELTEVQNWAPQEIEFTFQGDHEDGVYVLQTRNMAPRIKRHLPVFKRTEELAAAYVGSGIGVSGGALSGVVAFDLETIQRMKSEEVTQPIILIRSDTVPDDIREISIADGILTGKGGATSHAAIVAHRLEKTCVVGFSKMRVWEREKKCTFNEHVVRTGDSICIDGRSGAVYLGGHDTEQMDIMN
jgi:pyruvate,orthophosphate dikinase